MEYIILDLEWDSVYFKPQKMFINQILQIGAVRLNENFDTVGVFTETVRSEISNRVSGRFARLTGITSEAMREGIPFEEAVKRYNTFAEGAAVTMTWSNSDLYTILKNEEYLLKDGLRFKMTGYLDLQKLVQNSLRLMGYESKNQISLEGAAALLDIGTEDFALHTALDDCRVAALMLKKCYDRQKFDSMVRDTSSPDFYARLRFKPYPISDINDSNIKPSQLKFTCPECNGKTERLRPWKYRNRWFVTDFRCKSCGFRFSGRVAFKKTFDDLQVKRRVCEYRPKKRKNNDLSAVSETVPSTAE